ncbi:MAG: glycosyltransferase family 2 protein [Actinobacteria bacterium]|nr:glycosyltransferase family 2 protein [Actinomycetota bacterium]
MHHGQLDVVIPCYNYGRYVHDAVASALAQEGFATKVVVVDDGSTDDTADVLAEFPGSQVVLTRIDSPRGAANARNVGAEMSDGEFLAFLDADDLWPLSRSSTFVSLLGSADQLACGAVEEFSVDSEGRMVRRRAVRAGTSLGAMLMRRATFEQVGDFDTSYSVGENIDWDYPEFG